MLAIQISPDACRLDMSDVSGLTAQTCLDIHPSDESRYSPSRHIWILTVLRHIWIRRSQVPLMYPGLPFRRVRRARFYRGLSKPALWVCSPVLSGLHSGSAPSASRRPCVVPLSASRASSTPPPPSLRSSACRRGRPPSLSAPSPPAPSASSRSPPCCCCTRSAPGPSRATPGPPRTSPP